MAKTKALETGVEDRLIAIERTLAAVKAWFIASHGYELPEVADEAKDEPRSESADV